ncbi:MAG: KamA family radical SAM protein [Chloroflexi bacterium]|nr:KamA family radical SAM protein [Chloroflexota bacterium]
MVDEQTVLSVEQDSKEPSSAAEDEPPGQHAEWNSWIWQMQHRIRSADDLRRYMPALDPDDVMRAAERFPMAITPYYAGLMRSPGVSDPIYQMSVPQLFELVNSPYVSDDPLEEHDDMPVPGLIRRYPDRALFIISSACAMYCRHCTRKREVGVVEETISQAHLEQAVAYLREHPDVSDVILSGGDPLVLSDHQLECVLSAVRSIPSVQIIRIGTRVPVTMPMRITPELVAMLRRYQPIWINTHFNHPVEITPASRAACAALADAGFPLGNQSVLLRGVNDQPEIIETLCRELVAIRVRPYYLYQCDLVRGVEHFRTPLTRGLEIMEYLRGRLSGLAIPTFVVDAPHGGGKIPLMPNYIVSMSPTHTVLRNCEGMLVSYPEPDLGQATHRREGGGEVPQPGVWELVSGKASAIYPADSSRIQRRKLRHGS